MNVDLETIRGTIKIQGVHKTPIPIEISKDLKHGLTFVVDGKKYALLAKFIDEDSPEWT